MKNNDYLNWSRKALGESIEFFRTNNKPEREKSVVSDFFKSLGTVFNESDLQPGVDEPIDIRFGAVKFQLKEIMDSNRRRHDEFREAYRNALAATEGKSLLRHCEHRDITLTNIYEEILSRASLLLRKYEPGVCRNINLLFYVNLLDVYGLVETPYPDITAMRSLPWQSVSFLMGFKACVLFAQDDAPAFLKSAMGKVIHRPCSLV